MSFLSRVPLHILLRRVRWLVPLAVFAVAALERTFLVTWLGPSASSLSDTLDILILGVVGSVAAWIGLTLLANALERRSEAEHHLQVAYDELEANHQSLLALNRFGEQIAAADSEETVLELAAQAPIELMGARASSIVTFDDAANRVQLDVAWGLSEQYVRAMRAQMDAGIDATRCRECTTTRVRTRAGCPLFVGLEELAEAEGIASAVCMPIVREKERVGAILAYFPSADGPPDSSVRLLNVVQGEIAGMLDSRRLRARQMTTISALDQAAASEASLDRFTEQVLHITAAGWDAEAAALFLYEASSHTWTCRASHGLGDEISDARFELALNMARQTLSGAPVIASTVPRPAGDVVSAAAAPLVTEGQVFGALFLGAHRPRAFTTRHTDLLTTAANQIALAVRNAQLYEQVRHMAVFEERYRLSREIHDGLAQTLAYLGLQMERLEKLVRVGRDDEAILEMGEMRESIRAAYVDAREAIDGLRLAAEHPEQVAARLADYVAHFRQQTGIETTFAAVPADLVADPDITLQLLRIAQEALTNVRKHAHAERVEVRLVEQRDEIEMTITDDGDGLPPALAANGDYQRHGMATMRERAQSLGGRFSIVTGTGQGTRIIVAVPHRGRP
ncbi:MAG: GAF domain-containing protein [Anaerolineae bacterium]